MNRIFCYNLELKLYVETTVLYHLFSSLNINVATKFQLNSIETSGIWRNRLLYFLLFSYRDFLSIPKCWAYRNIYFILISRLSYCCNVQDCCFSAWKIPLQFGTTSNMEVDICQNIFKRLTIYFGWYLPLYIVPLSMKMTTNLTMNMGCTYL